MDTYRDSHRGDGRGAVYESYYAGAYERFVWERLERPLLERVLGEHGPFDSALDFACGTGRILEVVRGHADQVVGVDISPEMLAEAESKLPDTRLVCADLTIDDALPGPFDLVTAFRFFLNAEPALREDALEALRRRTVPGSLLVVNTHVTPTSFTGLRLRLARRLGRASRITPLSARALGDLLLAHGFDVLETHPYRLLPPIRGRLPLPGSLMGPLESALAGGGVARAVAHNSLLVARRR